MIFETFAGASSRFSFSCWSVIFILSLTAPWSSIPLFREEKRAGAQGDLST